MTTSIESSASYSVSGRTILHLLNLLPQVGQYAAASALAEDAKRIIGPLVWTEEDLPDVDDFAGMVEKIGRNATLDKLNGVFYLFDEFESVIERVGRRLEDVCYEAVHDERTQYGE